MKVFIVGDHRTGTGPANVTKEYINNFPGKALYQKMVSKALRVPEMLVKIIGCDVILFSGYSKQNLLGIKLARIFHKPTAYLMHGCVEYENNINQVPDPEMARCERAMMAGVDRIYAVSERFANWLKENYPECSEKIDFVTNGVETTENVSDSQKCTDSDGTIKRDIQIDTKKTIMLFSIGGGMPRKMIRYIADAVSILQEEGLDASLTVVGDKGADTDVINAYPFVHNLGLVNSKRVKELFRESDVFIQNSCFETFGLAPVEALANGCSVLLSKHVGALDIIKNVEESDIINSYNEPKEIAEKIKGIYNNPNATRLLDGIDFEKYSWKGRGEALCLKLQEILKK